jgi:hypothetical protein
MLVLVGVATGGVRAQSPQAGQITFYNGGALWKLDIPGAKNAQFAGAVFQEKQKLAEIYRARFLTLTIDPGTYTFSASLRRNHPAANSQMLLTVEPGKQYFVRVVTEVGSGLVPVSQGRLDLVTCEVAQKEAAKMKPLEGKYVDPAMGNRAVSATALPGCS